MVLIRCKCKCYSRHFIIYGILNNVLNFCNSACNLYIVTHEAHIPTNTPWSSKHNSADNNVIDIFVRIQFMTIDWCSSCFSAIFFATLSYKTCLILSPYPHELRIQRGLKLPRSISKTLPLYCRFFSFWGTDWILDQIPSHQKMPVGLSPRTPLILYRPLLRASVGCLIFERVTRYT